MLSLLLSILLIISIFLIYYFSSTGEEYSPSGKIYQILKDKRMSAKEIIRKFPPDVISSRVEYFKRAGLLREKKGKLYVTSTGKIAAWLFGLYGRILG